MTKMYIPKIGEKIRLIHNWKFNLYWERRNEKFWTGLGLSLPDPPWMRDYSTKIVIPRDTVLTISRIYIRQGGERFNSLTFFLDKKSCEDRIISAIKGSIRFWAKLEDVNNIEFEEYNV